ncbi:hypothetical protein JCM18899A_18550 [Nocardioides sp. AN3]
MTTVFQFVVTCCEHPGNAFEDVPGAVWVANWSPESAERSSALWISQTVPIEAGEAVRYIEDWEDGRPVYKRLQAQNGQPYRERIREACAACGSTLTMRDDTWNELSRRLEDVHEMWRLSDFDASLPGEGIVTLEATMSISMLSRLVQEMRGRHPHG